MLLQTKCFPEQSLFAIAFHRISVFLRNTQPNSRNSQLIPDREDQKMGVSGTLPLIKAFAKLSGRAQPASLRKRQSIRGL